MPSLFCLHYSIITALSTLLPFLTRSSALVFNKKSTMAQNSKFSVPACTAMLGDSQEFRLVLSISFSFYTNQLFVVLFTVIKYFDSMYLRICLFEVLDVKRIGYITLIKKKNEVLHNTDQKKSCLFSKFCYAKSDT